MKRCAEQSNPPVVKNNLLQQALRYKAQMDAGFTIKPSDVPAQVLEAILLFENETNKYKKKKRMEIKQKMRSQTNGI